MKNKALTLTIVAKMTSNYGEGLGNIGSVQKIYRNGKSYAIRSRESLKNAIMVQSGMYDDLKVDVDSGVTQKSVDENINASNCRALEGGYMNTTGETKIRRSSFYLTDAIAFEPFINEARFHNNLYLAQKSAEQQGINLQKEAKKSGLMPYQYEYDKSMKRYSITFDLDKVGEDLNFDAVADSQEKTERVNCILDAIKDLSLVVRGNMDNAEPLFVVGGIGDKKTHYFENVVSVEEKNLKINDDLLNKLKEGYKAGLLEGNNFDNEKEIEVKLNPVSISSFFSELKEEVKAYYENYSN
ncbi:type I-B CRISPR-associated protein Cas7/Cst2/DevR [Finegoldia magna]|uniref:type I-B CRISPR-associated protein Cas7/Cst2/DevR n=1 Tax=Finegoldia magna TaxID=1260 RepID=UPI000B91AEA4|nr:type I-B CRISPR-associated protein Cas7/Cst2/DevR [Finegoldia magna]OXZ29887.1 type I-B CRISPR-associated protein Cas7/Cst2/DevR [Finegoldia magna]